MPSDKVCTDVVSSGPFPETLQARRSLSAQHGLTEGLEERSSVLYSLTMSQTLGVT